MSAILLPPADELPEALRAYAARGSDGSPNTRGNELLQLWSAAPEAARAALQHHSELIARNSLGSRLTELVRLAVASRTGCPI